MLQKSEKLWIQEVQRDNFELEIKLLKKGSCVLKNSRLSRLTQLKLRPTVSLVLNRCQWCRVQRANPNTLIMGDLPPERLGHHRRPFTYCGINYFSPLIMTVGRRLEKRWRVLITCVTTRAVHVELAASLNTSLATMSLRRMMDRRGNPTEMFSDNGTNLVGMNIELRKAIQEIYQEQMITEMTIRGIKWRFIPPSTPHVGGSWEWLVRSVKVTLAAVLKERAPKEEVLLTLLTEAEHIVNSRPLSHVSLDYKDKESLTPNHFLIGSSSGVTIPGAFNDGDFYSRKHFRQAQRFADMFWSRWMREYLPTLIVRKC